ncbi:MAG: hypothetical protein AB7F43_13555 [Bacteriovoracia bacterium]
MKKGITLTLISFTLHLLSTNYVFANTHHKSFCREFLTTAKALILPVVLCVPLIGCGKKHRHWYFNNNSSNTNQNNPGPNSPGNPNGNSEQSGNSGNSSNTGGSSNPGDPTNPGNPTTPPTPPKTYDTFFSLEGGDKYAQPLIPNKSGKLSDVGFLFKNQSTDSWIRIRIYADDGFGRPHGGPLGTLKRTNIDTQNQVDEIGFNLYFENIQVVLGQLYWIVIDVHRSAGDSLNLVVDTNSSTSVGLLSHNGGPWTPTTGANTTVFGYTID